LNALAIIAVGTELTRGKVRDSHIQYLSSELSRIGVEARECVLVPDDPGALVEHLGRNIGVVDLLIVTGGLGPTSDDITAAALAGCLGKKLVFNEEAWAHIAARFSGCVPPETNRKQACIPEGFEILMNPNGTAPGFYGTAGGSLVFCLPGPPRELEPMFQEQVVNLIRARLGGSEPAQELAVSVFGQSESLLEQALQESVRAARCDAVSWGTRIDEGRIAVILRGASEPARRAVLAELRSRLGDLWVREGDQNPAQLLHRILRESGRSLAAAESCTGGLFAKMMTDIPGSSDVFLGGCVTYSNASKTMLLGVPQQLIERHGAVSGPVVEGMARGAMQKFEAEVGIGISGIAGPAGGTAEKPVGTVWIAVAGRDAGVSREAFSFPGTRRSVRQKAAAAAAILAERFVESWPVRGG